MPVSRKPAKRAKKPSKPGAVGSPLAGPSHPALAKVAELEHALAQVNQTLIGRNAELDAARQAADRMVFKDVVVLTALLDAKAFLTARGGVEAALIIHGIAQVEQRLGTEAVLMATAVQRLKSLAGQKRGGFEVTPEDIEDLLTLAQRLL